MKSAFSDTSVDRQVSPDGCISTEKAKRRLSDELQTAVSDTQNTLIEAPTSLGKTYQIATTAWREYPEITGDKLVVHLHPTTDARDQAAEMSESAQVKHTVLKGRTEQCPVAKGDYNEHMTAPDGSDPSNWFDKMCDEKKFAFSRAHRLLEEEHDELPCQQDGGCRGTQQWDGVLQNKDEEVRFDVIHATHQFAYISNLVKDSNIIIDERPDYKLTINQEHIRKSANRFFEIKGEGHEHSWERLVLAVKNQDKGILSKYRSLLSGFSGYEMSISEERAYKHTVSILRALVSAKSEVGERFAGENQSTNIVMKGTDVQLIRRQPPLSDARCVIGLDAHPCERLWEQNLGTELQLTEVLDTQERKKWRQDERGLTVVQLGDNTRTLTSGWWNENQRLKAKAIIREVRRGHGESFRTCITTNRVEDDVMRMMGEEGISNHDTMHYGEQNSRNDFASEKVGLLLGCNDPGDEAILDLLAEQGLNAEPKMIGTDDGPVRAVGREFTGPDANAAHKFLKSVREENVAQAIGRYARDSEEEQRVTVYVWTDAIFDHLTDLQAPGVTNELTETKINMYEIVQETGPVTIKTVKEKLDCTKEHVRQTFNSLVDRGLLTVSKGTGAYGASEYDSTGKSLLPAVEITKLGGQRSRL